ncbi:hypothetical protein [Ferrovibrio sp.]|uniref:hypothetical protein n=1 Tax=Ferrovibrio sp. TaxID=1917215 RepID=UPI0025BE8B95|nr:hypothetical protein [Ferrovibrio sp.]
MSEEIPENVEPFFRAMAVEVVLVDILVKLHSAATNAAASLNAHKNEMLTVLAEAQIAGLPTDYETLASTTGFLSDCVSRLFERAAHVQSQAK